MKKIIILLSIMMSQIIVAQNMKLDSEINKLINQKITESKIPGIAASIIFKDTIYYGFSGSIAINNNEKINSKTLFHIGSNTKAFTSFLAFQEIKKGNLTLDTNFFDVFPELKNDDNKTYQNITLSDLLSHNAQVQAFTSGFQINFIKITKEKPTEKRIEFAEQLLKFPNTNKGTYSNAGYVLASMMIEKVANKPFEEILSDYLTLNNWDYSYGFPNKKNINNAWGHWIENNQFISLSPTHEYSLPDYFLAAGDLSMNIEDYSKWLYKHLKELNNENEAYLKMHFGISGLSYGWGNANQNGQKLSFHDGSTGTFFNHTILLPENQIGITVMANAAQENQISAIYQLRQEIFEHLKQIVNGNNRKP
nr:serine hydrolase domain-containing protein [uncultured Flavobacterium sp.]